MAKKDPVKARAEEHLRKNLERALKEERTGLVAVARVFLEEAENPDRVLRRIEAMARNEKASPRMRSVFTYAHRILSRAAEQIQGQPQGLFDPHVGHVSPVKVQALSDSPLETQMGLQSTPRNPLGDVEQRAIMHAGEIVRDRIVSLLEEHGPLCDADLWAEYVMKHGRILKGELLPHRKELTRTGRIVEDKRNGERRWTLLEKKAEQVG